MVGPGDELRHRPGAGPDWEESWELDFVADDGRLGGYVRLAFHPRQNQCWYWAAVVGPRRPLVVVRDHDVDLPRGDALEIRASGLWAQLVCETPLEHWSTGLEAFAVAMDDPMDAYGDERGQPEALGLDLEWEAATACHTIGSGSYVQPCVVHGDVLVGDERLTIEGHGSRAHAWGDRRWSSDEPRLRLSGRLDDGTWFDAASTPPVTAEDNAIGGLVLPPDGSAPASVSRLDVRDETGANGLVAPAEWRIDELALRVDPIGHAPVGVPVKDGRQARVARALVVVDAGGRRGTGWAESVRAPAG